jgi:hypothetical protein
VLHRSSFFAGFIWIVLLSACGLSGTKKISTTARKIAVVDLPDGYTIVSSALQKADSGTMEPFFLMQNKKDENEYLLYPSGRKFTSESAIETIAGPDAGNFFCQYCNDDDSRFLITGTGQVPIPPDSILVLCQNGKDYAMLREQDGRIETQVLFVNGQKKLTTDNSIRGLTFSPDGSRLVYGIEDSGSIAIKDVFSPDSTVHMPSAGLKYYSFSFGTHQILRIHYYYSDFEGIREEESFLPDEDDTHDEKKLLAARSLFFHEKGRPFFLRGRKIRAPKNLFAYSISPDFTSIITFGTPIIIKRDKKNTASEAALQKLLLGMETSKRLFLLNMQIAVNGHPVIQKITEFTEISLGEFSESDISADYLRYSGFKYHIDFSGGGLPLAQLSFPSKKDPEQISKTFFRMGRNNVPRFSGFRIPDGCNDCGRNIAVLTGAEGKEYLMIDGDPGNESFDAIHAVSVADTGAVHFIADKDGKTALYDCLQKLNSKNQNP